MNGPHFIIVKRGHVQYRVVDGVSIMPVFKDRELAKTVSDDWDGTTVAEIGSMSGETLEGHLEATELRGGRSVLVTSVVNDKLVGTYFERAS